MPNLESTRYTFGFATAVCVVCALLIAVAAVGLRERQETNALLYRQKNVLQAAGLLKPEDDIPAKEMLKLFDENIRVRLVDLATGELVPEKKQDPKTFDQRRARNDPATSRVAPPNHAGVSRLPHWATAYFVKKGARVRLVVLPLEGVGMWGTLYGFIALEPDGNTVRGLSYYDQKETPGLGGEVGNPKWHARWDGRRIYNENWEPQLVVIKGKAGPADKDPLRIDGLSGATITSNAVSRLTTFWMGNDGWGRFLKRFREGGVKP